MSSDKALLQDFARWCRAKGFPRPAEEKVLRQLFRAYMDDRAAQDDILGALGDDDEHVDIISGETRRPISREGHFLVDDGSGPRIEDAREREPDDFEVLIERQEQALRQAGGDQLAAGAILHQKHHAEVSATAPFSRDAPPSITRGLLGNQAQPTSADPPAMVATWTGDSDADATSFTAFFAAIASPPTASGGNTQPEKPVPVSLARATRVYGIATFGTRGFLSSIEVDIGQGVWFNVAGSQVMLLVGNEYQYSNSTIVPKLTGMLLSPRPLVRTLPLTRTRYIDDIVPGTQVVIGANDTYAGAIALPTFAYALKLWRSDVSQPVTLTFTDQYSETIFVVTLGAYQTLDQPIQLTPEVAAIYVASPGGGPQSTIVNTSKSLVSPMDVRVIFQLSV